MNNLDLNILDVVELDNLIMSEINGGRAGDAAELIGMAVGWGCRFNLASFVLLLCFGNKN